MFLEGGSQCCSGLRSEYGLDDEQVDPGILGSMSCHVGRGEAVSDLVADDPRVAASCGQADPARPVGEGFAAAFEGDPDVSGSPSGSDCSFGEDLRHVGFEFVVGDGLLPELAVEGVPRFIFGSVYPLLLGVSDGGHAFTFFRLSA